MLKNLIRKNAIFFTGFVLIILFGAWLLSTHTKAETFLFLNPWHTDFLNYAFRGITWLGDGIFVLGLSLLLLLLKKKPAGILILASFLLSGAIAQLIKSYYPSPRPFLFFTENHLAYSYFIQGITLHNFHSFPSGHTTSVFAMVASISFLIRNKAYSILLLLAALIIGYSRIYLGQHFPEDVMAGMIIGVISATCCYLLLDRFFPKWRADSATS